MSLVDTLAMDTIADIMSGKEWSADTLDAIAIVVRSTARQIKDVNDAH